MFLEKLSRLGSGLELIGAVAINLSGDFVLAGRLLLGDLGLPLRGFILLRIPVIVLIGIGIAELLATTQAEEALA